MTGPTKPQLALAAARKGDIDGALASLRIFLRLRPNDLEGLLAIAYLLIQSGQYGQALASCMKAVARHPQLPAAHVMCGLALRASGRPAEAIRHYDLALAFDSDLADALIGRARGHAELGDSRNALQDAERCLAVRPGWPEARLARADALAAGGRIEESIAEIDRLLADHPGQPAAARMAAYLSNFVDLPKSAIRARHLAAGPCTQAQDPEGTTDDPGRELVVGVLSSDLRRHSVGHFAESFMRDPPDGWRLVGLMNGPVQESDATGVRLRKHCDEWMSTAAMDDAALDAAIRRRGIDVLVELNGFTAGNRLGALDRKPAPVIVTAIGYPNTTGHPCIDWRVVDSVTDPPGAEEFCTERLLRIDPCFLCYSPPDDAPDPRLPRPEEPFTFGSFNLALKISDRTAALWAQAVAAVPGSRLVLKSAKGSDASLREVLVERLRRAGIPEAAVSFLERTGRESEHLALYSRVHVALDTTPYNGTTTTCEALWMGVPVVAIEGDRHAARVGASLLRAAGLPELVARTPEEFASIAAALAADRPRLESLRHGLRDRLRASALMDAPAYAERFHAALRHAWRERCARERT